MKTQWPLDENAVYKYFSSLAPLLWDSLDYACDQAVKYLESLHEPEPLDPWLYSHLARHHCRRWLAANGISDIGFEIRPLHFSGIWVRSRELDVRVLKVDRRLDPQTKAPSRRIQAQQISNARREYYYQPRMSLVIGDGAPNSQRVRLLALWDNNARYQLQTLDWACPKWLDPTKGIVETHWWLPIPREGVPDIARYADAAESYLLSDIEPLISEEDESTATSP